MDNGIPLLLRSEKINLAVIEKEILTEVTALLTHIVKEHTRQEVVDWAVEIAKL